MLYTICYAGHTTVYIIGIYMVYWMIYIYVYTMVYTITSFLYSSPTASLSPATPLVQRSSRRRFSSGALLRASVNLSLRLCSAWPCKAAPTHSATSSGWAHRACFRCLSPRWNLQYLQPCFQSGWAGWDAIQVCDPLWNISIITKQKPMALQQHCLVSFGLQQMNSEYLAHVCLNI